MQWQIREDNTIPLNLQVDDVFLLWVKSEVQHPVIALILPWQNVTLDQESQKIWLRELRILMDAIRAKVRQQYLKGAKLPKVAEIREQLLSNLVERYLSQHNADWQLMKDLESLLDLAISTDSIIYCISS
ncbi:MAG: hypothetical protein HC780_26040 [Leptolyngbyaceae cyanobacterium CSU_1_3]|nr:hypothetical protein [Leptolyngbyaceae cyanobacterium CSU_1_3]